MSAAQGRVDTGEVSKDQIVRGSQAQLGALNFILSEMSVNAFHTSGRSTLPLLKDQKILRSCERAQWERDLYEAVLVV